MPKLRQLISTISFRSDRAKTANQVPLKPYGDLYVAKSMLKRMNRVVRRLVPYFQILSNLATLYGSYPTWSQGLLALWRLISKTFI